MTFESFLESNFTRTGNFKALFCAAVGFNLWHVMNVIITPCWRPKQMGTYGAVWEIVRYDYSFRPAKVGLYLQTARLVGFFLWAVALGVGWGLGVAGYGLRVSGYALSGGIRDLRESQLLSGPAQYYGEAVLFLTFLHCNEKLRRVRVAG